MRDMHKLTLAVAVFVIVAAAGVAVILIPAPAIAPDTLGDVNTPATTTGQGTTTSPGNTNEYADLIGVDSPTANQVVSSPLSITGEARGTWYFEASFPVKLLDAEGTLLSQAPAQARGDWMTEDFVPFTATLTFVKQPAGSKGTLVVCNDNPSGLPENEKCVTVPVVFR